MSDSESVQSMDTINGSPADGRSDSEAARIIAANMNWMVRPFDGIFDADDNIVAGGFEELGLAARELGMTLVDEKYPNRVIAILWGECSKSRPTETADKLRQQIASHNGAPWHTW